MVSINLSTFIFSNLFIRKSKILYAERKRMELLTSYKEGKKTFGDIIKRISDPQSAIDIRSRVLYIYIYV